MELEQIQSNNQNQITKEQNYKDELNQLEQLIDEIDINEIQKKVKQDQKEEYKGYQIQEYNQEKSTKDLSLLDKLEKSNQLKEEGNKFFREKNYTSALRCYYHIFLYLDGYQGKNDKNYMQTNQQFRIESDEIYNQIVQIKIQTNLNMSQAFFNQKKYQKALEKSQISLSIKETAKGLYKRAQAYIELQDTDLAIKDLNRILEIDNTLTSEVQQKLSRLQKVQKQVDNQQQKVFQKMFE